MHVKLTRGERFKDARIVHNQHGKQTMKEVHNATGVSESCIKDLEDDSVSRQVGYQTIAILAKHYGVSADYLIGLSDLKSLDPQLKSVCNYTGLSEEAVKNIRTESKDAEVFPVLNYMLSTDFDTFHELNRLAFKALYARKKQAGRRIIEPLASFIPEDKRAEVMGYLEQWSGMLVNSVEACEFYELQAEKLFRSILERIGKKMEADNGEHSEN